MGLLGNDFFNGLFLKHSSAPLRLAENVVVGPVVAVVSFVCSIGDVPLAAVLWSGGIGFAGVIAFIFADLIVLPIIAIYRKYYGRSYTIRIVALILVAIIIAALLVDAIFTGLGLVPHIRPTRADILSGLKVDYKPITNAFGVIVFALLFALAIRRDSDQVATAMHHASGSHHTPLADPGAGG